MKFFLVSLLSMSLAVAFGKKDTVITYYGYQMNEIKKKDYCAYYRKTFKASETTFGFLLYYSSGILQMTGSLEMTSLKKTGNFVYYNIGGVKIKEENYLADLKEGEYRTWFDDGKLELEGNYKLDKKSGLWSSWHSDGSLKSQGNYVDGEKEGDWKIWYSGDRIASEGNFKSGKKAGEWKLWFKNGTISEEGVYMADKREGDWIFYFESGKVSAKEFYKNGEATKVEFWDEDGNSVEPTDMLEKDPEFPGGEIAMMQFIQRNVVYPEISREMGEQGLIYVGFTVSAKGEIYDIKILKGASKLLDAEAIRVVKKMPDWIPGFSHNRIIDIDYVIPIKFAIA